MRKRIICFCVILSVILTSLTGRIAYITFSNNYAVSKGYNSYSLTLETVYPTVYYSSGDKMTNNKTKYLAILKPNTKTISDLHNLFSNESVYKITSDLKNGYPIVKEIDESKAGNVKYIQIYEANDSEYPAKQLISASSSGLLKYLKPCTEKRIRFNTDALGRMLQGSEGEIYEEELAANKGLKTTIDAGVQQIAYDSLKNIGEGCAIIMDVKTSSLLACVTKPDSSYINKPFEQYSVGSVFKTIVALCALENNVDYYYTCYGKTKVGDTVYSCQKNHVHSFQGMEAALANSCNCYFVNLALKLGKDKILNTARKLGFDDEIKLYNNWSFNSSVLPSEAELGSMGELALFGFGQGKLTATPAQICYALCTIGNGGKKNQFRFALSEETKEGTFRNFEYKKEQEVFKKKNCDRLIEFLRYVVSNGTGKNANDKNNKSAGKTATAQTGQYINNYELLNTWFAGVYPYDNPEYAIVVMCENGKSGSEDCAPAFRYIVEKLSDL